MAERAAEALTGRALKALTGRASENSAGKATGGNGYEIYKNAWLWQ
ncbi:MAG: hypothetical protein UFG06_08855 [Lachnospiraceae bacterium]|nr:hypothetical protein [Lachnospiraceae bacterium]